LYNYFTYVFGDRLSHQLINIFFKERQLMNMKTLKVF